MKKLHILTIGLITGCAGLGMMPDNTNTPLLTVGNEPVSRDEFIYAFNKNRPADSAVTKTDVDEYLNLYINFKLKVAEARARGMDTTRAFKKEFASYISQLNNSYLQTRNETDSLVREAFERLQYEVKAAHILFAVDELALPADTLKAYNKALAIRDSLEAGASFATMAVKYSDDPSARQNKGDLGYFTVLQMVYPFETAAYTTPVGEVSLPVRTKFGYHLIKVLDKRHNEGRVSVAHIMIRKSDDAKERAFQLYDQLMAGADWEQLCQQNSADTQSASRGGVLPPFRRQQIVAEFADAAFNLTGPGEISDPVQTPYGWHIIKLIEKLPPDDFAANEQQLRAQVKRDSRARISRQKLHEQLAREHNLVENTANIQTIVQPENHKFLKNKWRFEHDTLGHLPLFTLAGQPYSADSLYKFISKAPQQQNSRPYLLDQYKRFKEEKLLAYEKAHLAEKYPEYKFLKQEYYDGILLFSIMEEEVWAKASRDSVGLAAYYEQHRQAFIDTTRMEAVIFTSNQQDVIDSLSRAIPNAGTWQSLPADEKETLASRYNEDTLVSLHLDSGEFVIARHPVLQKLTLPYKETTFAMDDHWYYVIPLRDPYQPIPLAAIKGRIIADYQEVLEDQWLQELKNKYPVTINEPVLKNVYQTLEKP